jgi:L-fuculose-phosphate aldolase
MLLPDAREAIVTACQELSRAGLVVGTAGNVSVRDGDLVAVSPSGLRYAELTPEEVPVVHYYTAMFGGPVRVSPYATYGTDELAANVVHALQDRTACLMGNHGAVAVGPDLPTAHDKSVYLEWLCDVYLRASSAGTPRLLSPEQIAAVAVKLEGYGQQPPG